MQAALRADITKIGAIDGGILGPQKAPRTYGSKTVSKKDTKNGTVKSLLNWRIFLCMEGTR